MNASSRNRDMDDKPVILINEIGLFRQVARINNGQLTHYLIEPSIESQREGDIYLARVEKVVVGLRAAFVSLGRGQSAFLPLDKKFLNEQRVSAGQLLVVQVQRLSSHSKPARVTLDVTLANPYLVFLPLGDSVVVSKKIKDKNLKRRAQKEFASLYEAHGWGGGYILRNSFVQLSQEQSLEQVQNLQALWSNIKDQVANHSEPRLLQHGVEHSFDVIRDWTLNVPSRLIVQSLDYEDLVSRLTQNIPWLDITQHSSSGALFTYFDVHDQINQLSERKLTLPSGGTLVFDEHEGITSIDVNSAKQASHGKIDWLATNLEAAKVIAQQLRLRNIGGLIVIDFIDMQKDAHKQQLESAFSQCLSSDDAEINVAPLSVFGLVELTRSRRGPSLNQVKSQECQSCLGAGHSPSVLTICDQILIELLDLAGNHPLPAYTIVAAENVVKMLAGLLAEDQLSILDRIKAQANCEIRLSADPHKQQHDYAIVLG